LVRKPGDATSRDEALMRYGTARLKDVLENPTPTVDGAARLEKSSFDVVASF
jgi:hypothetical protein